MECALSSLANGVARVHSSHVQAEKQFDALLNRAVETALSHSPELLSTEGAPRLGAVVGAQRVLDLIKSAARRVLQDVHAAEVSEECAENVCPLTLYSRIDSLMPAPSASSLTPAVLGAQRIASPVRAAS